MYCLDTYALIEIHNQSVKYAKFKEKEFVIPESTMAEFYLDIFRKFDEKTSTGQATKVILDDFVKRTDTVSIMHEIQKSDDP